ncbi:CheR family methyltransferase [Treponema pectinovorum]|uniref:CheR family methyltransferase n=1 Tax=Treponema pectinovorum TaxID=164 RepID=UPI0020905188|nr:CheR family methyltransferase [Treponema pectinovorum]
MANETMTETKSINDALAQNLGAYANTVPDATKDASDKNEKIAQIDYKMVTFSLAGKDYAINIMKIKEIAKAGRFTYVPNTLPFVLGVYNLRGEIIPIVDLRLFFNIDVEQRKDNALENMLIVSIEDQTFGIVVDVIDKVVGIQKATIQPPHPLFGDINIKYIQGVVEVNNRLYILLDIERIFGSKGEIQPVEEETVRKNLANNAKVELKADAQKAPVVQQKVPTIEQKAVPKENLDLSFIKESLMQMRKFCVSSINESWVKERFSSWVKERGKDNTQLSSFEDADSFLKNFYSPCTSNWWTKEYADSVYKILPENSAKQITVWNPGCGKGMESYSLACLLKKRYPDAKIKIYAHDIDLLVVSNAPLISVPASVAEGWYAPFVTNKANNDFTFSPEVKTSVMFEYHDCANTNALPVCDMIFARDLISFLSSSGQSALVSDFEEKLKGNGVLVIGSNESLNGIGKWVAHKEGNLTFYTK